MSIGRGKDGGAILFARMLFEQCGHFSRERDGTLLPVFGEKPVLGFGGYVDAAARQVEVLPMEGLELAAAKAGGEREGEKRALPVVARSEEFFEIGVGVGGGALAELGQARHFLDRVVDFLASEEIVQNYAVGVEGGASVEALGLAPGEKRLHVLGSDVAQVGLGGGRARRRVRGCAGIF
jgi:hypothetical protein